MAVEKEKPYPDDYFRKGMLVGGVVRSTIARGKIRRINIPKLPQNCFTVTAADIPGSRYITIRNNKIPILASREVNYKGEAVILAAAPDSYTLEEILKTITIEYEELPPITDNFTNVDSRTVKRESIIKGNPTEIFKNAENVIYGIYSTGLQEHFHSDYLGAIAENSKDKLNIITSSEWPHHVRRGVAEVLNEPEDEIRVYTSKNSPSYGAKMWYPTLISAQAALLTRKSKKTVKFIIPKAEEIITAPKRTPVTISHKTAVDNKGKYIASEIEIDIQAGAYPTITDEMLNIYIKEAMGVYYCKNISVSGRLYTTNIAPLDIYTNIGLSPVMFASEMHNTKISRKLKIDPYVLKLNNLAKKIENFYTPGNLFGELNIEDFNLDTSKDEEEMNINRYLSDNLMLNKDLIDLTCRESDYKRKHTAFSLISKSTNQNYSTPQRGIGLSIGFQGNEYQDEIQDKNYKLEMRMSKNDSLEILTSALPESRRILNLWKKIASDILNIKTKNINIMYSNTDIIPDSGRFLYYPKIETINKMIESGAKKISAKRFRDPLPISTTISRKELVSKNNPLDIFRSFTYGAAVVEIEINPLTSEIETKKVTMCIDCGQVRNKTLSESRLKQSIMESLNWCIIDQSPKNLLNRNILTYRQSKWMPEIKIKFIPSENESEKGIEEIAYSIVPSAFLSAVSQATRTLQTSLPIDPFNIFQEAHLE